MKVLSLLQLNTGGSSTPMPIILEAWVSPPRLTEEPAKKAGPISFVAGNHVPIPRLYPGIS